MSDEFQINIPQSFLALFVATGRQKWSAPRDVIVQRYELCEDMSHMLLETVRETMFSLGVTEQDVLQRCRQGLTGEQAVVSDDEADWVTRRIEELMKEGI